MHFTEVLASVAQAHIYSISAVNKKASGIMTVVYQQDVEKRKTRVKNSKIG